MSSQNGPHSTRISKARCLRLACWAARPESAGARRGRGNPGRGRLRQLAGPATTRPKADLVFRTQRSQRSPVTERPLALFLAVPPRMFPFAPPLSPPGSGPLLAVNTHCLHLEDGPHGRYLTNLRRPALVPRKRPRRRLRPLSETKKHGPGSGLLVNLLSCFLLAGFSSLFGAFFFPILVGTGTTLFVYL